MSRAPRGTPDHPKPRPPTTPHTDKAQPAHHYDDQNIALLKLYSETFDMEELDGDFTLKLFADQCLINYYNTLLKHILTKIIQSIEAGHEDLFLENMAVIYDDNILLKLLQHFTAVKEFETLEIGRAHV